MFFTRKYTGSALAGIMILVLSGCGAQFVRDRAQAKFDDGDYETALRKLEEGTSRFPDSVVLKSGQIITRDAVFARLVTAALSARTEGKLKEADAILQRALSINPNDERAAALRLDIARDVRAAAAVASAKDLRAKGLRERAMVVVESALKDSPKNAELLSLQRQEELSAREHEMASTRLTVNGTISLDFRDANVQMLLEALTRNSGVNFVVDKDVRPDLRTTVFLRQTSVENALELITSTTQLKYKVLDPTTVLIYPKTPEKIREYQDLMIRAFYLSSAEAKQTATLLKSMLKVREPFVDEKLNMVMIRESAETVRLAERIIALHDMSEPEVMMDVEVLEVKRAKLTELGVKYPDSLTLSPIAPEGSDGFTLGNVKQLNRNSIGIGLPNLTLNLRRDIGDVHILANPKIRARNREKAKVLIGDKLPVVTTTGSAANNGFFSESVQYVDVGLKLDVEPNVFLDDEVAIKVGLEVSSLVREIKTAGGSLVYQIGTRTAQTVLRLRDGETQLLAGLISNEERMSASRVPGLGDLPLLGRLFSNQRNDAQRTEIVLAITPRIIQNIRRPDLHQTEFWSGTENDLRSRAVTFPAAESAQKEGSPGGDGAARIAAPAMPLAAPGSSGAAPSQPAAMLSLAAPTQVAVGDVFSVDIKLKSDSLIRGLPVELQFSSKLLELMGSEEGDFFKKDGASVSATKALTPADGTASMAILRNIAEGIKGEGTVMTFKFRARAAGAASVRIMSSKPIASQPVNLALPGPVDVVVK